MCDDNYSVFDLIHQAIFQHGANSYFNNEPGEFYQRLISAFHTVRFKL